MDRNAESRNLVQNVSRQCTRKVLQSLQPCSKDKIALVGTGTSHIGVFGSMMNRNGGFTAFKVFVDEEEGTNHTVTQKIFDRLKINPQNSNNNNKII